MSKLWNVNIMLRSTLGRASEPMVCSEYIWGVGFSVCSFTFIDCWRRELIKVPMRHELYVSLPVTSNCWPTSSNGTIRSYIQHKKKRHTSARDAYRCFRELDDFCCCWHWRCYGVQGILCKWIAGIRFDELNCFSKHFVVINYTCPPSAPAFLLLLLLQCGLADSSWKKDITTPLEMLLG